MSTKADVQRAADTISDTVRRTPILTSEHLDRLAGCHLYFKCENFQKTGAFKARGALHAIRNLPETTQTVITHSSGNHGAALAWAARTRGIKCVVVCPASAAEFKRAAIERYGGEIISCGSALEDREKTTQTYLENHSATFVPPYDSDQIICGQGTVALEFQSQVPSLDQIWVPVGGGGLIGGCVIATERNEKPSIVGAEPTLAGETFESLKRGYRMSAMPPKSIADGLLAGIGVRNFAILQANNIAVHLVSETQIREALVLLWSVLKILIEPSSAVPFAAILQQKAELQRQHIGVVLSGGNYQPRRPDLNEGT